MPIYPRQSFFKESIVRGKQNGQISCSPSPHSYIALPFITVLVPNYPLPHQSIHSGTTENSTPDSLDHFKAPTHGFMLGILRPRSWDQCLHQDGILQSTYCSENAGLVVRPVFEAYANPNGLLSCLCCYSSWKTGLWFSFCSHSAASLLLIA